MPALIRAALERVREPGDRHVLGFWARHYPDDRQTADELMRFLAIDSDSLKLSVLRRTGALTDIPVCVTFEALDAAYPGS